MTEVLVQVEEVSKSYRLEGRAIPVLKGADLSLRRGELASLIGKSGAGKSTLLHLLGALDAPTAGRIRFEGEDIFTRDAAGLADFRGRSVGFVFQFHHLLREFSALENVMLPGKVQRLPEAQIRKDALEILDRVGLAHRAQHRPGELSGGEQQRVALARALLLRPPLLLADEPTGNLDAATAEEIHELIFDLNRQLGITAVVVTHNPTLAAQMPTRLRLEEGRITVESSHE